MTERWLKIISVVEIVGGVSGIIAAALEVLGGPNGSSAIFLLVFVAVNLLSLYAGVALWLGRSSGRIASIIVQALQLPKIVSPVVIYMISFGFDLYVYFVTGGGSTNAGFEIKLLTFSRFAVNVEDAPLGLGISLVSCIFLAMLLRYKPAVSLPEPEHPAVSLPESEHPAAAEDNQQEPGQ
jgi:hypothetical protein